MPKVPSPCVDVCKYKRQGHCIACSMTKAQKALFKELKKDRHKAAFIDMLLLQQQGLDRFPAWRSMYEKKCKKRGVNIDKLGIKRLAK